MKCAKGSQIALWKQDLALFSALMRNIKKAHDMATTYTVPEGT